MEKNLKKSRLTVTLSMGPIHIYRLIPQEGWFQHLTLRWPSTPLMVGQWLAKPMVTQEGCGNVQRFQTKISWGERRVKPQGN